MEQKNNLLTRDKDILLGEYAQLNELYRHRGRMIWMMGSIFIPVALAILSYAVISSSGTDLLPLAICSLGILVVFRFLFERMRYFARVYQTRIKEIEKTLGMDTHSRFGRIEADKLWDKYKKWGLGSLIRTRHLLSLFVILFFIAWILVLLSKTN